jgi:hypothetical protein
VLHPLESQVLEGKDLTIKPVHTAGRDFVDVCSPTAARPTPRPVSRTLKGACCISQSAACAARASRKARPMKSPMTGRQPRHHTMPVFKRERVGGPTPARPALNEAQ